MMAQVMAAARGGQLTDALVREAVAAGVPLEMIQRAAAGAAP
jgi:hypothetical protein